jgi:DNA-binding transcriptional MerR regulator
MKRYSPAEFSKMVGVCVKTLQRWDKSGKLKADRTVSNRRQYTDKHFELCSKGYAEKEDIK